MVDIWLVAFLAILSIILYALLRCPFLIDHWFATLCRLVYQLGYRIRSPILRDYRDSRLPPFPSQLVQTSTKTCPISGPGRVATFLSSSPRAAAVSMLIWRSSSSSVESAGGYLAIQSALSQPGISAAIAAYPMIDLKSTQSYLYINNRFLSELVVCSQRRSGEKSAPTPTLGLRIFFMGGTSPSIGGKLISRRTCGSNMC
ncbi:hypothetical protein V1515DRAFT_305234 [Lipomyces mesembrius]